MFNDDETTANLLLGLLESSALERFAAHREPEMTFADACRFWKLHPEHSGAELDARLLQAESALNWLDDSTLEAPVWLYDRRIGLDQAILLREVHEYLLDRFSRHLNVLRSR